MTEFTRLENDLLAWFKADVRDANLEAQLDRAEVGERTVSRVGQFLRFVVPDDCGRVQDDDDALVIPGPGIESPDLPSGAASNIFVVNGVLDHLEIYTFGDVFTPEIGRYSLVDAW